MLYQLCFIERFFVSYEMIFLAAVQTFMYFCTRNQNNNANKIKRIKL